MAIKNENTLIAVFISLASLIANYQLTISVVFNSFTSANVST